MSTIFTDGFQRDKFRPAATQRRRIMRSETSPPRIFGALTTAQNESVKPIVSQNFSESLNNRTLAVNDIQIIRHNQSSAQVR